MLNLSPAPASYQESLCSLQFGSKVNSVDMGNKGRGTTTCSPQLPRVNSSSHSLESWLCLLTSCDRCLCAQHRSARSTRSTRAARRVVSRRRAAAVSRRSGGHQGAWQSQGEGRYGSKRGERRRERVVAASYPLQCAPENITIPTPNTRLVPQPSAPGPVTVRLIGFD